MLTEPQLIAYLEGTLAPDERAQVETVLAHDEALRQRVLGQMRLDAALRSSLGGTKENERVKQSVLAVLRGESEAALKRQVLADTARPTRLVADVVKRRPFKSWLAGAQEVTRRFTTAATGRWAIAGAAAALALFVWFGTVRSGRTEVELPSLVQANDAQVVRNGTSSPWNSNYLARAGDELRVASSNSATIHFADGTALHLEPATRLIVGGTAKTSRSGGKQFFLLAGALSATVARQSDGRPLLIETPHALVTVVGTEFDLRVATNRTSLEVTHGLVKMTGPSDAQPVSVAAGEFAVASPKTATQSGRLARNPFLWPFSSDSPWNTPLGNGAKFEPWPGKSILVDGPLVDGLRSRRPFMGGPPQPLRGIWINGERRGDVRFADVNILPSLNRDAVVLLQGGRRFAFELRGVTARADGDLDTTAMERLDLAGPGVFAKASDAMPLGLSSLGGLIRAGETENGIRHALAARVSRDRLGGRRDVSRPSTVWPATGGDAPLAEFLNVGTLLALPSDVDIRKLAGDSGAGYEIARAMQDYGVYVTGTIGFPFALLTDSSLPNSPSIDALLNQLVPLLRVVSNNTPQTPGGGGEPRRPSAPRFPNEAK